MAKMPTVSSVEEEIGMKYYFSDTPALGGRLKDQPEDFIVNEISDKPIEKEDGEYVICSIKSRNWETNRMIRAFSKNLRISRNRIKFAGTKDKRAVTTQLFSFPAKDFDPGLIEMKDIEVLEHYRSNKDMELGLLFGNNFLLTIRDIKGSNIIGSRMEITQRCMDQLVNIGGFPNYFGIQRFGAIRPVTHLVGKHIVKNDPKQAALNYLIYPKENEEQDVKEARARLEKEMDFEEATHYFPSKLIFERMMIHHLKRRPEDWGGAINQLPDNLRMMFVHAYQSYLFNEMLSKRIEKSLPLNEPLIGDIVISLNKKGLPDHRSNLIVTSSNFDNISSLIKKKKGFVSGLIFGTNSALSKGDMGEIEASIIEKEKIDQDDFNITCVEKVSSKGMRRELLSPIFDLKWKLDDDKDILKVGFSLFRGTYATSFMREIMKTDVIDY